MCFWVEPADALWSISKQTVLAQLLAQLLTLSFKQSAVLPAYLPPLLRCVQFLLDLLQRGFLAGRSGGLQFGATVEGGRLQDDLEGLAAGALAQLDHLHVADVAQVQVDHALYRGSSRTGG